MGSVRSQRPRARTHQKLYLGRTTSRSVFKFTCVQRRIQPRGSRLQLTTEQVIGLATADLGVCPETCRRCRTAGERAFSVVDYTLRRQVCELAALEDDRAAALERLRAFTLSTPPEIAQLSHYISRLDRCIAAYHTLGALEHDGEVVWVDTVQDSHVARRVRELHIHGLALPIATCAQQSAT